ncbi:MAG: hypothetical protein LBR67_09460 [Dysgonamonadaceae bacterium]|nr:hypothetical protein [Dysgonamonadaceae bacterium]
MSTETTAPKNEFEIIKEKLLFLIKYWYYFVISMVICIIIAAIYVKNKIPVFNVTSTVSLRHDESIASGASMNKSKSVLSAFGLGGGAENIEDETIKMASQGYVKKVIRKYGMNTEYKQSKLLGLNKIKLYDKSPVIIKTDIALPDTLTAVLEFFLKVNENGTTVKMKNGKKTVGNYNITSFPAHIQTPLGEFAFYKTDYYDSYNKPLNLNVLFSSYDFMAQIYRTIVEVDFEKKTSDLIHLNMNSENVPLAKFFINALINNYNYEWSKDRDTVTTNTENYISNLLTTTTENLSKADMNIKNFKDKYNLTDIEADVKYYFAASGELQPVIMETTSRLKMVDIIIDFIRDESNKYAMIPYNAASDDKSLAEVTTKYNELLSKRNDLFAMQEQSGMAKTLNNEIEAQRNVMIQSLSQMKKGLEITLQDLHFKEKEFAHKLGNIPAIEQDFIQLKRDQEVQQAVYLLLLEMQIETGVKGTNILPKLKVIDEPYAELKPVEPNMLKVALTTILLGGFVLPISFIYLIIPFFKNRSRRKANVQNHQG